jgi:hypothetical protein
VVKQTPKQRRPSQRARQLKPVKGAFSPAPADEGEVGRRPDYLPPWGPPPIPHEQDRVVGTRPAVPLPGRPWMQRPYLNPGPDRAWMESVVAVRPGYTSGVMDPDNAAARPAGSLRVSYRLYNGHRLHSAALLTGYIADGVMAPVHQEINLPDFLDQATGVIELVGPWPNPFPPGLFGFHRVSLDLWAVDPSGQPLPAEFQTDPPDMRRFLRGSGDSGSLYVEPGCRSDGGLEWSELKSFSVAPTTLDLDSTGQRFAAGQKVRVEWNCTAGGPPATQYGYPGSWRGVWINGQWFWPDFTQIHGPLQADHVMVDLGGKPFWPGIGLTISPYYPYCGFAPQTIVLTGRQPTLEPPPTPPIDLVATNPWYEPTFIHPGTPFTVHFTAINAGGTASGPFVATLVRGNGAQTEDVNIPSLPPGFALDIPWPFTGGLGAGDHYFQCILDSGFAVAEVTKLNNVTAIGIIVS